MALEFDEMSVDTTLAQNYLTKEKGLSNYLEEYEENVGKKIIFDGKEFTEDWPCIENDDDDDGIVKKLDHIVLLLKQHVNLFAQLEYYLRKIPVESTVAQVNLIINHVLYVKPLDDYVRYCPSIMTEDSPILNFGCTLINACYMPNSTSSVEYTIIETTKPTAAVSYLFASLCNKAGFRVLVHFRKEIPCADNVSRCYKDVCTGTLGVVCEDADLDSAVDVFVCSVKKTPWELRRILVQESVYQQFKDALRWKCDLSKQGNGPPTSAVLCAETMSYSDKTFVIDPLDSVHHKSVVTVEAYRTAKELLSLADKYQMVYLSLWANGIEGINEITHSVKSSVIWVNSYADFRGPPQIAEAIYSYIFKDYGLSTSQSAEFLERARSWAKLDIDSRRLKLYNVLPHLTSSDGDFNKKVVNEIRDKIGKVDDVKESFVYVGKDYICTGVDNDASFKLSTKSFLSLDTFTSLLRGKALSLNGKSLHPSEENILIGYGVPVVLTNTSYPPNDYIGPFDYVKKVIWNNMGTIFAN